MAAVTVSIGSTATLIGAFPKGSVTITNTGFGTGTQPAAPNTVYLGPNASVTTSSGMAFPVGSKLFLTTLAQADPSLYAITASGISTQLTYDWAVGA